MRLLSFVSALTTFVLSCTSAQSVRTAQITYESLDSASKPLGLASISYDPLSLEAHLLTWTPPSASDQTSVSSRLLRVRSTDTTSTLTTLSAFNETLQQTVTLHLDNNGDAYSASISARRPLPVIEPAVSSKGKKAVPTKKSKAALREEAKVPKIVLLPTTQGPRPKLNQRKQVKLDEGGREVPQEEPQKTFFQKYWWVFLLVSILALSGGGDK